MKVTIILDEDTAAILECLAAQTGLSIADIASRPLGAHLADFCELLSFLEAQRADTVRHDAGINLLVSFGPESISAGLARIAPEYEAHAQRFGRELNASTARPPARRQ
jgi:hypothetical protein